VLHPADTPESKLSKPAIRPYPIQYVAPWILKGGEEVQIRPIRPEDEPLMVKFHQKLSERTVYMRYFQPLKLSQRTAHERLTRICFVDYDREMALVTVRRGDDGEPEIIAVGRLSKLHGREEAEIAALVRDEFQGKGLGTELYRRLLDVARSEKLQKVTANMLAENREMAAVCKRLGFKLKTDMEDNMVQAEFVL
jgi:acetyltransferase